MWEPGPCPEEFQVDVWRPCWVGWGSPAPMGDLEARHAPHIVNASSRLWGARVPPGLVFLLNSTETRA